MLKRFWLCVAMVTVSAVAVAHADPKDEIKAAIDKVSDAGSYSWTSKTEGGFMRGTQDGKTDKDGFTWVKMQFRDSDVEVIRKGDKSAIKTDSGWKTAAEVMADSSNDEGGPPSPERRAAMMASNLRTPIQQAQENLDSLQNIQKTDDGFTADFSPEAAKALLTFRPRRAATQPDDNAPQIDVSNAKATVKVTIKDGAIAQMQLHITGTVDFNGNQRDVDRTVTTDIKDVGSTTVDVPADAKAKLAA